MGWIQLAVYIFQLIFKIWDACAESHSAKKAAKGEALKEGLDAVIKMDASAITRSFDRFNRIDRMFL